MRTASGLRLGVVECAPCEGPAAASDPDAAGALFREVESELRDDPAAASDLLGVTGTVLLLGVALWAGDVLGSVLVTSL